MTQEIKKLIKEVLPYKKNLIIVAITGIIMSLSQGQVVVLINQLLDSFKESNPQEILKTPLMILGLYFILGVSRYNHLYRMNFTGELVVQKLRSRLQKKFMNLSLGFHNNYSAGSGGLISRILNDIIVVQHGLRMIADFFREPLLMIFLISWLFYLNWKLTLTIIVVLPFVLLFLRQISKTIKTHSIKGQEDLEKLTSTIKESLDGVRVIQSFNLENQMADRFDEEGKEYLYSRKKVHKRVELSGPVTEFVAAAVIVSIAGYIGSEIAAGRATVGTFGSYLAALLMLNQPIKKLQESYVRIQETVVAARRIFSLLEEDSEVPESTKNLPFPKDWKKIEYKDVCFNYGAEPILKNINLTIHRGEMVAFVGASGSGKSTLVNLLERFFEPTSGNIYIDDVPLRDFNLKDLRANIGLVTQDVFLFSESIEKNIWAGDLSKPKSNVQVAAKAANAESFIQRMPQGYESRAGDRGNLLSGGEKQRISIARALLKDAPILILDEATSALDTASEIEVQKGLDLLMKGRTSLVIAHRLSTVTKADKIVVLKSGSIVEVGNHDTLLDRKGEYTQLYELQYKH